MNDLRNPETDIQSAELKELLREMNPLGGMAPFSVEEKREAYRKGVVRSGPPEEIGSVVDQSIPAPAGELRVRIYKPLGTASHDLPVVLYLHGGGFISGDLDTHDPLCRSVANHVPSVVMAVNYRLAPESAYPAAIEDCFAALTWLISNAATIGGDPSRISVVGDSAGGNLAAVIPLMARDRGLPPLAAQVLIYPMVDATLSCGSLVDNAFIPPFTLVDCVKAWQLYLAANENRRDSYISPLFADSLESLPPALVITSEFDILADEGEAYADRLRAAGVRTEHEEFQGMIHGFFQWGGLVAAARLCMNRVVQFLQQATKDVEQAQSQRAR